MFTLICLAGFAFALGLFADSNKKGRRRKKAANRRSAVGSTPNIWRTTAEQIEQDRVRRDRAVESNGLAAGAPSAWSMELLREIEWKRFEEICEHFWRIKGYPAKSTGAGADGGVDVVIADRSDTTKNFAIIQCKSWMKPVGVEPVRALWGSKDHFKAQLALFYSLSGFSNDALGFAAGKHLKLVSGEELLRQISALTDAQQSELLVLATSGDYTTPSCPQCETKMVRRLGKNGKPDFWGCSQYPRCMGKPIPMRGST